MTEVDRIVIAETDGNNKVFGDLKRCETCKINFTAKQPCMLCYLRETDKEEHDRFLEAIK